MEDHPPQRSDKHAEEEGRSRIRAFQLASKASNLLVVCLGALRLKIFTVGEVFHFLCLDCSG